MKRNLLIYNPQSGKKQNSLQLDHIIDRFQDEGMLIQTYRIGESRHLKFCEVIVNGCFELLTVAGGDGTINMVVNEMLNNDINIPFGIIPTGTCNDFARSLGLPNNLDDCIKVISTGKVTYTDVGLVNQTRYFTSTFAGGVFVNVSYRTKSELKKNLGPLAYYLEAMTELPNIKSFNVKLEIDGNYSEEELFLFLIVNGKNAAGIRNIAKNADLNDGRMDLIMVRSCYNLELMNLFLKVINNDFTPDKNVMYTRCSQLKISPDKNIPVSMDGEKWNTLPLDISFLQNKLSVIV